MLWEEKHKMQTRGGGHRDVVLLPSCQKCGWQTICSCDLLPCLPRPGETLHWGQPFPGQHSWGESLASLAAYGMVSWQYSFPSSPSMKLRLCRLCIMVQLLPLPPPASPSSSHRCSSLINNWHPELCLGICFWRPSLQHLVFIDLTNNSKHKILLWA